MQVSRANKKLLDAFSAIITEAYKNDTLLSCHVLSRVPTYGNFLENYQAGRVLQEPSCLFFVWQCVRYIGVNIAHLVFLGMVAVYIRLLGWKPPYINGKKTCVIDTFAVLPKIAEQGRYEELYLPKLAKKGKEYGKECLYHFRLYGSRNPLTVWKALRVLAQEQSLCEVHLLRGIDWLYLCKHVIVYPYALAKLLRELKKIQPREPEYYIRHALLATRGTCVLSGEVSRVAGLRLAQYLQEGTVLLWYENQAVHKGFLRGLRQAELLGQAPINTVLVDAGLEKDEGAELPFSPLLAPPTNIHTIGMQLFVWAESMLNNHPLAVESELGLMPDKVVVNGPYFLPEGFAPDIYAVGASLRYEQLFTYVKKSEETQKKIVVLLSYFPDEVIKTINMVRDANMVEMGEVYFRFHPTMSVDEYSHLLPSHAQISRKQLYEEFIDTTLVIGTGTGGLVEAVACGIPVIHIQNSICFLPPIGQGVVWDTVRQAKEIPVLYKNLLTQKNSPAYTLAVEASKQKLFSPITAEFFEKIFE